MSFIINIFFIIWYSWKFYYFFWYIFNIWTCDSLLFIFRTRTLISIRIKLIFSLFSVLIIRMRKSVESLHYYASIYVVTKMEWNVWGEIDFRIHPKRNRFSVIISINGGAGFFFLVFYVFDTLKIIRKHLFAYHQRALRVPQVWNSYYSLL